MTAASNHQSSMEVVQILVVKLLFIRSCIAIDERAYASSEVLAFAQTGLSFQRVNWTIRQNAEKSPARRMVLLTRCCCWRSVRKGSFASGIFTLAIYLVLLVTSVFHVHTVADSVELLTLNIFCLIFSFFCVVSSVVLLVGLCVIENPWLLILFVTDLLFCLLSVYCVVCVISQYQQYLSGRGRAGQTPNCPPIPTVRFQPSAGPSQPIPSVSYQVTQQNGAPLLLTVPTPNSSSISGMGHTDMSSVSDDPSSSRGRGSSTDDTCGDDSPPAVTLRIQKDTRKKK
ncbi:hypothetical protein HNY73_022199 [Argiope bruennichi]|uniref:Uncharacterized protein n=1 Tax=Argiope bruennichi TaxID=94029 RepID=A0A8T0E2F7_ARGBR|nr:hypothetical protein HNY73_022199 [Argiope bruennichi]